MADVIAFLMPILIFITIYIILAVSLNLVLGFSGHLNLGHIALFGIGAYTSALLNMGGYSFIISFILAGIISSFFGFLLIFATKKLSGDYYALATLGFLFVIYSLLLNLVSLTNGPIGIAGIPKPVLFGFVIGNDFSYLIFTSIIAIVTVMILRLIVNSPFGKLLEAMRDDETRVKSSGRNAKKLKYKAMTISAFFAGISGSLFAHYISYIDPGTFFIDELILILTIVVLGGIASLKGSVIASFVVVLIPEILRFLNLPSSIVGPFRQILFGLILLLILIFRPKGIYGRIDLE